jgi:hypothetical protein
MEGEEKWGFFFPHGERERIERIWRGATFPSNHGEFRGKEYLV